MRREKGAGDMGLAKLYVSMAITIAIVTAISAAVFYYILEFFGTPSISAVIAFIIIMYIFQWIISPYVIDLIYRVRPLEPGEEQWLQQAIRDIAARSGVKPPKPMLAQIRIPNAFAYGNPFTGYRVAVTEGLLDLDGITRDEIKAVVGHEIGHIKHHDITVMMLVGLLPAIILWLGQYLMRWGWLIGFNNRREGGLTPIAIIALGAILVFIGFLLNLGILYFSRLREYYADSHAARTVENGARNLMRALARIMVATGYLEKKGYEVSKYGQLKALFIESPDHAVDPHIIHYGRSIDHVIELIKSEKPGLLSEIFSTHPHPAKRFRFLEKLEKNRI